MSSRHHNTYMVALAFVTVGIAAGAATALHAPMNATLVAPMASAPATPTTSAAIPTTPPVSCGRYSNAGIDQCGGACPMNKSCTMSGNPFFNPRCTCETTPTQPPTHCGFFKDTNGMLQCGGECAVGQTCGTNNTECLCVKSLPTTPPVSCGLYQDSTGARQCGGACPAGETCSMGNPFFGPCSCASGS